MIINKQYSDCTESEVTGVWQRTVAYNTSANITLLSGPAAAS